MALSFEWDEAKAKSNLTKHGTGFAEASTVFGDPLALSIDDPAHSEVEDRFVTLEYSQTQRMLVVVQTDRGDNIRIISARRANKKERKTYEEIQQ